jgi:serine/threonine protein kinase
VPIRRSGPTRRRPCYTTPVADREAEGYRLVGEVASGPTHHLVRAVREHDGRAVVIKTLRSKLPDPRAVAGLLNEHELLTACAGPGVVEAVELRWSAGLPQLVLADAGPASLIDLLGAGGMPLARFWPLARELAGVLARVHAQGVLHRDINPANFALSDDGNTATLVDFGLATRVARVQATPEEAMVLAGTLEYISPEQTGRTGLPVDQRSDLYSLGATYFALLTGRPPFTADDPRATRARRAWPTICVAWPPTPPCPRRAWARPTDRRTW